MRPEGQHHRFGEPQSPIAEAGPLSRGVTNGSAAQETGAATTASRAAEATWPATKPCGQASSAALPQPPRSTYQLRRARARDRGDQAVARRDAFAHVDRAGRVRQ